jgi:hypothetical protein
VSSIYREQLSLLGVQSEINYSILSANVVAALLREKGLELIALFDGFDNDNFAVLPIERVPELKELEAKIEGKGC